jgi:hypothetical protein
MMASNYLTVNADLINYCPSMTSLWFNGKNAEANLWEREGKHSE